MGQRFCTILLLSFTAVWARSSGIHAVTVVLDEGVGRTIECPRPLVQRLNITSARYVTGTCESPGALQTLQARCGGEPSCTVRAGDNVFGARDSCPGQSRLEFSYECRNLPGYHGCFEDSRWDRALIGHEWESHSLTIQDCLQRCRSRGFKYAGVESADECFCGNNEDFGRHGMKPMSECNLRCARDDQQFCGGHWRIEVFESFMGGPCVNQTLDGAQHYVYSPDFPGLYPRSKTCEWTGRARGDRVVKLHFEHFNLSSGDVITVRDGSESSQDLTPTSGLTGTTIPTVPASSGSALWVQFRSDDGRDTRGRFIFWSQEIGHCGPVPLPPDAGTAAAPYAGNVGVGETATVICNSGVLVWVRCGEGGRFNDTGPYCQDETTAVSSTASSVQTPHYFSTPGLSTSPDGLNPSNNAGQEGEGTGSTVTFIAVGVVVPLVVIATVAAAVVLCKRRRTAKNGWKKQASYHDDGHENMAHPGVGSQRPGSGSGSDDYELPMETVQPPQPSSDYQELRPAVYQSLQRNTASKSPGSAQASPHEFTSSRVGAPPGENVGLSSHEARCVVNGGTEDPGEHLYAESDDGRPDKSVKPGRRGDRTENKSPVPPVNHSFTENELYETTDDVTRRHSTGLVENSLYLEIN
ncbi:KREMEN1 [Branchiostoma lanceolatum]|uniref:KREMEN1 protein n=1 Tax=Branchiostoma lanceolatum TaxID=7740 RepID=A0A8K0ABM7_BRALA|nr:KREMEN1 [Branchiostoma lanceolatum]